MNNTEHMAMGELYIVHNSIMAVTHEQLSEAGRTDLADRLQKMAQDADGAFILHTLTQVALNFAYLDASTEPQQ